MKSEARKKRKRNTKVADLERRTNQIRIDATELPIDPWRERRELAKP